MLSSSAQGRVLGTNLAALEGAAVFLGSNHKQQTKPRSSASPSSFVYLFFIFSTLSADRRGSYKQSSSCSIPLPLSLLLNSSIGRVSSAASSLSFGIQQPATIAKQRTNQWQKRPSSASSVSHSSLRNLSPRSDATLFAKIATFGSGGLGVKVRTYDSGEIAIESIVAAIRLGLDCLHSAWRFRDSFFSRSILS